MNNEREMLKFAARACGYTLNDDFDMSKEYWPWCNELKRHWHPIVFSADCAAMCAKLDINSMYALTNPIVSLWKEGVGNTPTVHHNEEHNGTDAGKEAAWRFAACKVAEAVGRAMK